MKCVQSVAAIALLSVAVQSPLTALATSIPVANYSFESPAVGNPPYTQVYGPTNPSGTDWTISGPGSAYVQSISQTFPGSPGGDQSQFGLSIANSAGQVETWSQVLMNGATPIAFQPNTTYTVDIDGAYRDTDPGITNVGMQFGLQSTANPGVDLTTAGFINLPNLPVHDVFYDAASAGANGSEFTFTTGASPTGDLLLFIRNEPGVGTPGPSGFRIQFDDVRVNAVAVPEPATFVMACAALVGLLLWRIRMVR